MWESQLIQKRKHGYLRAMNRGIPFAIIEGNLGGNFRIEKAKRLGYHGDGARSSCLLVLAKGENGVRFIDNR